MDMNMSVKRALVWGVSMVTGFVMTWLLVYVVLGTDLERYSISYFVLTAVPLGFILLIWGDLLLGTRILPD